MIELAFGESAAGALKYAKSMKHGTIYSAGANGVIGGTKEDLRKIKMPRKWSGKTMAGSSRDVAALTLALDIGDISDIHTDMTARKKQLDDLFADYPDVSDAIWHTNQSTLARLQKAKETLESVCMWICASNPAELCGFNFVCSLMADTETPLSVVRVPEQIEKDGGIVSYHSTGEIDAELLGAFSEYEEPINEIQRGAYAITWSNFVRENAPLRAVVNGNLMGVPEYFYDFALRANMPDGKFVIAQLIGKTLIQISGVSDHWLFLRIQAMLQSGELIAVSAVTGDHPYSGVVKRGSANVG